MGKVFSRPSNKPDLKKQYDLRDYSQITYKKYSVELLLFGGILMLIGALYLWLFKPSDIYKFNVTLGLLLTPLCIWGFRNLLKLYFEKCRLNSERKIKDLIKLKNDILDNIKKTKTYEDAIEILNKFGEKPIATPISLEKPAKPTDNNNNKALEIKHQLAINDAKSGHHEQYIPKTPRPILPPTFVPSTTQSGPQNHKNKSFLDKMVESLIGDGNPNYRYALICTNCHNHNGMALKEEFPFLAFRCVYCKHFNPARDKKPPAPDIFQKLTYEAATNQLKTTLHNNVHNSSSNESSHNSSSNE